MAVRFFRATIELDNTQETKANNIASWIDGQIVRAELHNIIGDGNVGVHQNEIVMDGNDNFVVGVDMYITDEANLTKYVNAIQTQFQNLDKTGVIRAKIIKNSNCTHDEANPQPDVVTTMFEWSA